MLRRLLHYGLNRPVDAGSAAGRRRGSEDHCGDSAGTASDFAIEAVHIGMLGNEQVVKVVADFLAKARPPHVVLDPILKSTSGADLLDAAGPGY